MRPFLIGSAKSRGPRDESRRGTRATVLLPNAAQFKEAFGASIPT